MRVACHDAASVRDFDGKTESEASLDCDDFADCRGVNACAAWRGEIDAAMCAEDLQDRMEAGT